MSSGDNPVSISPHATFSEVVDESFERLKDKQVQYSIRKIHEMENTLNALEHELDQFLFAKAGK